MQTVLFFVFGAVCVNSLLPETPMSSFFGDFRLKGLLSFSFSCVPVLARGVRDILDAGEDRARSGGLVSGTRAVTWNMQVPAMFRNNCYFAFPVLFACSFFFFFFQDCLLCEMIGTWSVGSARCCRVCVFLRCEHASGGVDDRYNRYPNVTVLFQKEYIVRKNRVYVLSACK